MKAPACSSFTPYADPWAPARERWWDISTHEERQFDAFLGFDGSQPWSYANDPQVTITYDASPSTSYFIGHIQARRLKPNFAYQLKLTGKPVKGSRGFGANGDDVGNERLGYAGRWWCDSAHSTQTNFDDSHYVNFYKNAPGNGNPVHDIYGYIYLGVFVTDASGNADVGFTGKNSYHITWADWQVGTGSGMPEDPRSPFTIQGGILNSNPTIYYGYGSMAPAASVRLFYEYESSGRPRDNVVMPVGTYKTRFLLTEETFHNSDFYGGYWKSVLIADNVNFRIGVASAPSNLTATGGQSRVVLSWTAGSGATTYNVKRGASSGGPFTNIATGVLSTGFTDTSVTNGYRYYYVVTSVNDAGESPPSNVASAVPVDSTSPAVTISSPVDGSLVSSLPLIKGSATDNVGGSGINRVSVTLLRPKGGGVYEYWNSTTGQWQLAAVSRNATLSAPNALSTNWVINSGLPAGAKLTSGIYFMTAHAYDNAGKSAFSGTKRFTVDSTAPTVTITNPVDGSLVSSLTAIKGSATDNVGGSGINRVSVTLLRPRGGGVYEYWNSGRGQWQLSAVSRNATLSAPNALSTNWVINSGLPTGANLASGVYFMTAHAYDNVGKVAFSGTKRFTV